MTTEEDESDNVSVSKPGSKDIRSQGVNGDARRGCGEMKVQDVFYLNGREGQRRRGHGEPKVISLGG